MKRQILIIIILLFCKTFFGQNKIIFSRGNKTVTLKKNRELLFHQGIKVSNGDSTYIYYEGCFEKYNSDSIVIKPTEKEERIIYKDNRKWQRHTFYNVDTNLRVSLHLNDLDRITVRRPIAKILFSTAIVAGISVMVVAPLASINYKKVAFDKSRYTTIAGVSTGLIIPCWLLGLTFQFKDYDLKSAKRKWILLK